MPVLRGSPGCRDFRKLVILSVWGLGVWGGFKMRISRCVINQPARRTSVCTTTLYQGDLEYLRRREIPIARALRAALTDSVLDLKSKERGQPAWHEMTKAERDARIMSAPNIEHPVPQVQPAAAEPEIPRSPVPDMTGWTREERSAWILDGVIPAWVMMARVTAVTPVFDTNQ